MVAIFKMAAVLKKGAWLAIVAIFKARDLKLGLLIEEYLRKKTVSTEIVKMAAVSKWRPIKDGRPLKLKHLFLKK